MENTLSHSKTSDKMKDASSDDSVTISISISLWWSIFLRCRSKKMISKGTNVREKIDCFVELIDIN
jgi:hypothetical protein